MFEIISIRQLLTLIPGLAGLGSFFWGLGLILGGALIAGFAIALLGIMLMLFYAKLIAMMQQLGQQTTAQQHTAQMGQEFGQQGHGQQTTVAYPPIFILTGDARTRRQLQQPENTKVCRECGSLIPRALQTCPFCGATQQETQQEWRGFG